MHCKQERTFCFVVDNETVRTVLTSVCTCTIVFYVYRIEMRKVHVEVVRPYHYVSNRVQSAKEKTKRLATA